MENVSNDSNPRLPSLILNLEPENSELRIHLENVLRTIQFSVISTILPFLALLCLFSLAVSAFSLELHQNIGPKIALVVVPLALSIGIQVCNHCGKNMPICLPLNGNHNLNSNSAIVLCGACQCLSTRQLLRGIYYIFCGLLLAVLYIDLGNSSSVQLSVEEDSVIGESVPVIFSFPYVATFVLSQFTLGAFSLVCILDITIVHIAALPFLYKFAGLLIEQFQEEDFASDDRVAIAGIFMCLWWLMHWTVVYFITRTSEKCLMGPIGSRESSARPTLTHFESDDIQTEYVAQTLHDIGTPLSTLSLGLELLHSTSSVHSKDYLDILETMKIARDMMMLTRKKAMDYFRHQSGQVWVPNIVCTDLHDLVMEKCRRIMAGYPEPLRVPFHFEIDSQVSRYILTDPDWVWECAVNYLSNAQKFSKEGSIRMSVTFQPNSNRQFLRFEVKDTGPGVPDNKKGRLFKPFVQLHKGMGGTGLGLYSVMKKITALGGTVGVQDNLQGVGSIFFFTLPYLPDMRKINGTQEAFDQLEANEAYEKSDDINIECEQQVESNLTRSIVIHSDSSESRYMGLNHKEFHLGFQHIRSFSNSEMTESDKNSSSNKSTRKPTSYSEPLHLISKYNNADGRAKILIVEDDPTLRKFLSVMLQKQGYATHLATNGQEGLDAMKQNQYLAVLTDTQMPIMSGYEQVRRLREWESNFSLSISQPQYIISLSANVDETLASVMTWGCNAYLSKPVEMSKLSSLLRSLMEK